MAGGAARSLTGHHPRCGTLVLVVGPSGAGKDSLLGYAARSFGDEPRVGFPRRFITRPCRDDPEPHQSMTPVEFAAAREQGRFALDWQAHGLSYGVPVSLTTDLERGLTIALNVSRQVLGEACRLFRPAIIVNVTAPPHLLRERLSARGREGAGDVEARIARETPGFPEGVTVVTIDNSSTIETAGARFVSVLREILRS